MREAASALRAYWALLARYLRHLWPSVLLLATLLLCGIALQLANPQVVRAFIDKASAGGSARDLTITALVFLGMAATTHVLNIAATYVGDNVAWTATNALRLDLTRHCLGLDLSFHKAHTPGELVERIDGDVGTLANFFSRMAIQLAGNALLAGGIMVLLFREDWRTGLVGLGYVLLSAGLLRAVSRPASEAWGASRAAHADLFGFVGEQLASTEDLRANGAEPYAMSRLYRLMRAVSQRWMRAKVWTSVGYNLGAAAALAAQIAALGLGAALLARGQVTIGTVYLVAFYVGQLRAPMDRIQREVGDLQQASASIARIRELLSAQPSIVDRQLVRLPTGPLQVSFEGVSFQYADAEGTNGSDNVLQDISFSLAPTRTLGLLGRTGSGKTTLTRLLFRLHDPTEGTVRLGGVDLREAGLSDLRARIGLVTQDVQLFRASVRDNLTLFGQDVPDEALLRAFEELGLWEWYGDLLDGLDTALETGDKSLSAGEAQLLAFARLYLKDPGLIILDEASSRLDPATEGLLDRAIARLLQDRTAIIVAHRLSTVQRADEILIIEEGRIAEHGERLSLAQSPSSRFHRLLQTGLEEALA